MMGSSLDTSGMPSSLTQRRQAASNLPTFELPPPSHFAPPQYTHKFHSLSSSNTQHLPTSVGNLLTPPPNSGSDSGQNSANLPQHNMPVLPYTPTFWAGTNQTPTGFTGLTPQPWQNAQTFTGRSMFAPMRNDPNSPSAGGISLPPPPFELPAYGQQQSLASPVSQPGQHPSIHSHMLSNQGRSHSHQTSPISQAEAISRATSTPSMYAAMNASASPQPPHGFHSSTPVSQSPHPQSAPPSTTSPPLHHGPISHLSHPGPFMKPPYPSYSLPAMPGPVLTNVQSPGSQMSLVGNMQAHMLPMQYNSGYAANPHLQYAHHRANSPQQPQNQDRPFKCDECPQSFNRNHDLKRHKRIHLAVKPFPCNHCDKSFSRKDALKRHILVKGCGKAGEANDSLADGMKSESGSENNDQSSLSATA